MRHLIEFTPIDWRTSKCRGCGDVFNIYHDPTGDDIWSADHESLRRLRDHDCEYFQNLDKSKLP
jgi:hypothetical protein